MDLLKNKLNLYFCPPYSSWEKGSIENMNRLLRRYFAKGKNLPWDERNKELAQRIEDMMNRRPRKILGYRTPQEVDKEWNLTRRCFLALSMRFCILICGLIYGSMALR